MVMECLNPVLLDNPKYNPLDSKDEWPKMSVPCGKCLACLSNRRDMWFIRLKEEHKSSKSCVFVTLTYDEEHKPLDGSVNKRDCQLFMKRLRKRLGNGIRFFLVSEYGPSTLRPHYHMLLFNYPLDKDILNELVSSWANGFACVAYPSNARFKYVAKYCISTGEIPKYLQRPFMLCSRRPAIGAASANNSLRLYFNGGHAYNYTLDGVKYPVPRYYRIKLFSDEKNEQYQDFLRRNYREKRKNVLRKFNHLPRDQRVHSLIQHQIDVRETFIRKVNDKINKSSKL